ncbi:hypothetical protein EYC84_010794 [Monilinia fructicola]|uniref:Heterokaryon incompatibility domain-containing protein n=1 Tax=Monilinia fructicola TaxID=38448 RepID=A0A5M9JAW4_MONFR|nr:hypothetical protein EYC84_010794 [Monilinia fructicola]
MEPDKRDALIPPNDPKNPRWLLDIQNWKLERYIDVANTLEPEGYGIVSYTWGYIADLSRPQPDDELPAGLLWDVPTTTGFDLDGAKQKHISKRQEEYCVAPFDVLEFAISIENATAGCAITYSIPHSRGGRAVASLWLDASRRSAAPETILVDGASNTLEDDSFKHNGGRASVIDFTARITALAIGVAKSFFLQANGQEQTNKVGRLIDESTEMADEFRQTLSTLVTSGLVAYGKASPLYILSGKQSREFGMPQDACWALIGAMELEGVPVNYELPMDNIKMIFLTALFEKYQWTMLLLPQPLFPVSHGWWASDFRWLNIVDGLLIPVGLFVDTQIGSGSQGTLPRVSLYNTMALTIQPPKGSQTFSLLKNPDIKWYLHYVQTQTGVEIRSLAPKTNPAPYISDAVFLKLEDLGKNDNAPTVSSGMRCLAIMGFWIPDDKIPVGTFGGIVDIWSAEENSVEISSLKLYSSAQNTFPEPTKPETNV